MSTIKPTTVPDKRLSESITAASSSFKINSITGWDDVDLTSADFGSKLYAVFRNSAGTEMEIMSVDPTTITSASSAITILLRGLKFDGDLTTEVAGNKKIWVKGDTVVSLGTHVPQLLKSFVDIYGAQTIEGLKTFSTMPQSSAVPAAGADLINKTYADALVLGVLTTINVIVPGKAGETVAEGQTVYFDTTDNEWKPTDADTAATVDNVMLGIAQGAGTNGNAITGGVLLQGVDTNQSGLVEGDVQYFGNTAGGLSTTPGTTEVTAGIAKSATELYFKPRFDQQLTEDQQDALAGTSGTPSATNKFVTDADTRLALSKSIVFGDGSDGDVVISANTDLTRDMYYHDLTINDTIVLSTKGYKVFVSGTLTQVGTGKFSNIGGNGGNGGNAVNGTGATVGAAGIGGTNVSGTLMGGISGSNGGSGGGANSAGAVGVTGISSLASIVNTTPSTPVSGGNGGAGAGGAGGIKGTISSVVSSKVLVNADLFKRQTYVAFVGSSFYHIGFNAGNAGGGGGGGCSTGGYSRGYGGGGGGAGANGGLVMVVANSIVTASNPLVSATGGTGGNGGNGATDDGGGNGGGGGGGGAGGNGGLVMIAYSSLTGSLTATLSGGAAGTGGSPGSGGSSGSTGTAGVSGLLVTATI